MPQLSFGVTDTRRQRGNLPHLPVVNCFVERAPTEPSTITLQSRPGLSDRGLFMGNGPVECLFKGDGVLDGALHGVSEGQLFRETVSIGAIDGTGPVSMAGYEDKLFTAAGGSLWGYDGTTLAAVAYPDSANVRKVIVGASRVITIRADTEKYYWSDVLSSTIGGLSFATAENQPDRLKDVLFWQDGLLLFGSETVEFHPNTPDPDLPFQPLEGRTFRRGIRGTGCATLLGPAYAWVTDLNQVCIETPEAVVSEPWLQQRIEASATVRVFEFQLEGQEYLAVRLDGETWAYSLQMQAWSELKSWGRTNWVPQCFDAGVFGSSIDGKTLEWGDGWLDLGGVLERGFRAGLPLTSGGLFVDNLSLRTNPGNSGFLSGDYANPTVEAKFSRDGGRTWGDPVEATMGLQGDYRSQPVWMACGAFGQPGLLVDFRITDPVDFRVSDVLVNEPYGGV